MIDQVRSSLRHVPGPARGAEPAALATERHEFVVAAIGAAQAQAQDAVRKNSALEERAELAFYSAVRNIGDRWVTEE